MNKFSRWLQRIVGFSSAPPAQVLPALHSKLKFADIEWALQYPIKNKDLFVQALLHRSYLQYIGEPDVQSNERLEFLGDAVLNLVIAEYLYGRYPDAEEGELTIVRSRLVNRKALAYYAREVHLWDFLFLSSSASQAAEKGTDTILADAYEAIIGALYLDGGLQAARTFIKRQLQFAFEKGFLGAVDENYKSALLEYAQAHGKGIPRYTIVKEEGPDHDRTFTIEVSLGTTRVGIGVGKNKKEGEQAAAEQALAALTRNIQASSYDNGSG